MTFSLKSLLSFFAFFTLFAFFTFSKASASTTANYCVEPWDTELLQLINNYRASNGAPALTLSWTLGAAAQHHSIDMAKTGNFSHTLSDGTTWLDNIINHGYTYAYRSENIAWGYTSPSSVFSAWKASSGHNTTMLNTGFRAIGINRTFSSSGIAYWTNTFGGTADAQPPLCSVDATPVPSTNPTSAPTPTSGPTDSTKPTVSITYPLNGATVTRRSSVTIQASASDNIGVNRVEFYIGGKKKCADYTAPYSCLWSVGNKQNATYSLSARAYDAAGNVGNSTTVTVSSQ